MKKAFVVQRDAQGWSVFDSRTRAPVISAARELVGLTQIAAREEATLMNVLALNQMRAGGRSQAKSVRRLQ